VRTLVVLNALSLALGVGCSTDPDVDGDAANHTEVENLTLGNVFLEHAHPAYWEPGDARYVFPVAARVFYGFRPFDGIEIELSEPCRGNVVVQPDSEEPDTTLTLSCSPGGDESQAFPFTTASQSYGQEEQAFDVVLGTSFDFIPSVALERLDAGRYVLDVQAPDSDSDPGAG